MSVRLLAGPFPVKTAKGAILTFTLGDYTWYPHVGLLVSGTLSSDGQETWLVLLDGLIGEHSFSRNRGKWSWWPAKKKIVFISNTRQPDGVTTQFQEFVIEPIAMFTQKVGPQDGWETAHSTVRNTRYVKLPDRRIYPNNTYIARQVDGVATDVNESELFPFQIGDVLPGRSDQDMWVMGTRFSGTSDERGCFYDTVSCKMSSPVYFIQNFPYFEYLGYAPEYGVLVSVHRSGPSSTTDSLMVRVWSLEVEPTLLTDPVPFIGTPKAGQVVTYRVRVVGDHDDGAEGELVDWSVSGVGFLLDVQTKADANGYATARVQYGLRETGQSVVTARVVC